MEVAIQQARNLTIIGDIELATVLAIAIKSANSDVSAVGFSVEPFKYIVVMSGQTLETSVLSSYHSGILVEAHKIVVGDKPWYAWFFSSVKKGEGWMTGLSYMFGHPELRRIEITPELLALAD